MIRCQQEQTTSTSATSAFDDLHEWVLTLPWVVERPYCIDTPGVRSFGIDCEPIGRRQLWLLTGLRPELEIDGIGIAVVVPSNAANDIERAGWGRTVAPLPGQHALVSVCGESHSRRQDIEALVLTAYGYAMS